MYHGTRMVRREAKMLRRDTKMMRLEVKRNRRELTRIHMATLNPGPGISTEDDTDTTEDSEEEDKV